MRTLKGQSCIWGIIVFIGGCATSDGIPSIGTGTTDGRGGSNSSSSNAESSGGTGDTSGVSQDPGTGGTSKSSSATGGRDSGHSSSNAEATGGRSGVSTSATGGATAVRGGAGSGGTTRTSAASSVVSAPGGNTSKTASAGGVATGGRSNFGPPTMGGNATSGAKTTAPVTASAGSASTSTATSSSTVDCNATMPTGGTPHTGNSQGGQGNLAWQLWANNATNGSITTFSTPAFSASWNNAGDYLARIGYEWGNSAKTYDAYGQISAQFAYKKTGSGGGYSYIGIYGWSTNPCIEWYIVDDSFNGMPVNPGNTTNKGTVDIDGGSYILYTRNTTGTGGSRCSGVTSWNQFYSIRKTGRQCGVISITKHFDAWKAAGMALGNLLEAKILVEVGGGSGSVDFPVANVTAQ